jgi:hypothetical protein
MVSVVLFACCSDFSDMVARKISKFVWLDKIILLMSNG